MHLIIGLGNPGIEYEKTRHNMGFNTINKLSEKYNIQLTRTKYEGLYGDAIINGEKIILLKPQTFMNLSGKCIAPFIDFYKIDLENVMIIYDDMAVEPGTIKIRKKGGAGSHNGMKSIVQELATEEFPRIRVGIGEPENKNDMINYVIGAIEEKEIIKLENGTTLATQAVEEWIKNGIDLAMNKYNAVVAVEKEDWKYNAVVAVEKEDWKDNAIVAVEKEAWKDNAVVAGRRNLRRHNKVKQLKENTK